MHTSSCDPIEELSKRTKGLIWRQTPVYEGAPAGIPHSSTSWGADVMQASVVQPVLFRPLACRTAGMARFSPCNFIVCLCSSFRTVSACSCFIHFLPKFCIRSERKNIARSIAEGTNGLLRRTVTDDIHAKTLRFLVLVCSHRI